ncbi:MAG: GAF domain-containing protein [Anaerolineales bacterium]|nr:MAG: GAF domain-containing protein [Anaerolineales bacterium]
MSSNNQRINPEEATRRLYKNWREGFAVPLLIGVLIFGAAALIPAVSASGSAVINTVFIATYVLTGLVTIVRFAYIVRMSVFLTSVYVIGLSELITHGILGDSLFFFLALIIFSTILFSPRAGILMIAANILTFILFGWLILGGQVMPLNPNAPPARVEDWLSASAAIIMFGAVIILGFQRLEKEFLEAQTQIDTTLNTLTEERNNLETKVLERTDQLRKVNEVGRALAAILDPNELLPRAARLIESEFECYYTAFFFLDGTGQWAELKEASGEAGKVLRENKHHLDVNGKSMVAKAIRTKRGQIALESDTEQMRLDNPLLPYTRSQIALPLVLGDKVRGVLEMHSTRENAFAPQDVDAYQNLANEIAIALENSRLFQEAQQSLLEMRATQRQYLQSAWQSLSSENPNMEYALGDLDPINDQEIEFPLSLRDQIIGQIHLANTSEWTAEQKNLIETIATQATLALENARLVEESQFVAARERIANEIIAKIWSSTSTDNILQTAVRELGRTLEAAEVEIEVSMGDENE